MPLYDTLFNINTKAILSIRFKLLQGRHLVIDLVSLNPKHNTGKHSVKYLLNIYSELNIYSDLIM